MAAASSAASAASGGDLAAFISGRNMRVMAAAVQAISKIGKDVFLDASEDGVRQQCACRPTLHRPQV